MQITEQQFAALEQHHGQGMIIPLSVGDEDYVFRRPSKAQVTYALGCQRDGHLTFLEELALGCIVSPLVPEAGVIAGDDAPKDDSDDRAALAIPAEHRQALRSEKARLEALWAEAQCYRDTIAAQFAVACGWNLGIDSRPLGGGRYELHMTSSAEGKRLRGGEEIDIAVTASKPSREVYDEQKRIDAKGNEGDAERYLWKALVDSPNKDEVARLYPFAVIAAGTFLLSLGADKGRVRIKKFGSGPAAQPGSSTSTPPGQPTSA